MRDKSQEAVMKEVVPLQSSEQHKPVYKIRL